MRAYLIFAILILTAVGITEGQSSACNKRIYFCYLNPCQTRANTCRDPRDCRPDYCGGCKTKCVTTTPVSKRAIVWPTTRYPGFSAGAPDYCGGCKATCVTTGAESERARSQKQFYYCIDCMTQCFKSTPVPERAIVGTTTRYPGFSAGVPDYCGGCKATCVRTGAVSERLYYFCSQCMTRCYRSTPVPERAIIGTTTRHPRFSAGIPDYCSGCKATCATTGAVSKRPISQARLYYCGVCKKKCFPTTAVPERAVARVHTRASYPPLTTRRPGYFCGCKTKYVTRNPMLGRVWNISRTPCGSCSSSRRI